jgi:hypothetical protein
MRLWGSKKASLAGVGDLDWKMKITELARLLVVMNERVNNLEAELTALRSTHEGSFCRN